MEQKNLQLRQLRAFRQPILKRYATIAAAIEETDALTKAQSTSSSFESVCQAESSPAASQSLRQTIEIEPDSKNIHDDLTSSQPDTLPHKDNLPCLRPELEKVRQFQEAFAMLRDVEPILDQGLDSDIGTIVYFKALDLILLEPSQADGPAVLSSFQVPSNNVTGSIVKDTQATTDQTISTLLQDNQRLLEENERLRKEMVSMRSGMNTGKTGWFGDRRPGGWVPICEACEIIGHSKEICTAACVKCGNILHSRLACPRLQNEQAAPVAKMY